MLGTEFVPAYLPSMDVNGDRNKVTYARAKSIKRRFGRFMPRPISLLRGYTNTAYKERDAIRRMKVDLMHCQATGCEEMPVAANLAKVRAVIGTFHVDPSYDLDRARSGVTHRVLEWYSNRCLNKAIAVSNATKQAWMRRTGIPEDRVAVIHNGINPSCFARAQSKESARAALGLPQQAVIIGGLGRLDAAKGFGDLIEALALLRPYFPGAHLAIGGTGILREQLEAKAAMLGVTDFVTFLGFRSDVNEVLDACDIFAMPSLCETLGYALLEAMAHKLPAVGTTVGGIPEVIVPSETGLLAPPRDPAALANALKPLLESAELRERMGRAGRERVVRHFQETEMVRKTIDVYRQMLESNRGRA
jgi:glycosyltransferase involved in cell wall biosynthesis